MKIFYGILLAGAALASTSLPTHALDRDVAVEVQRLDQRLNRLQRTNESLLKDIRALQRSNTELKKSNANLVQDNARLLEDMLEVQNVSLPNSETRDEQIKANLDAKYKEIKSENEADRADLASQVPVLNWGAEERPCGEIGEHQQIQNTTSADGKYTLKYLCFDGRLLHLGTQLNSPPQ